MEHKPHQALNLTRLPIPPPGRSENNKGYFQSILLSTPAGLTGDLLLPLRGVFLKKVRQRQEGRRRNLLRPKCRLDAGSIQPVAETIPGVGRILPLGDRGNLLAPL